MNKPFRVCLLPVLLLPKSGKQKKRSVAKLGLKTNVHLRPCLSSTTLPGTNR